MIRVHLAHAAASLAVAGLLTNSLFAAPQGNLNTAREFHTATMLADGRILIAGGYEGGQTQMFNTAELYDQTTGNFTPLISTLNSRRASHTATLLPNGKVLLAGGVPTAFPPAAPNNTAELFDPANQSFTPVSPMNAGHATHAATLLPSGKVLITGGTTISDFGGTDAAEIFDPVSNTFTTLPPMTSARSGHTATVLDNGRVLIAGGYIGDTQNPGNTSEIFDPVSRTFTAVPAPMNSPRFKHTATLLPDGRVLIAGGSGDSSGNSVNTGELFDPVTQTYSPISLGMDRRARHAATAFANGKVLATGGIGGQSFGDHALNNAIVFNGNFSGASTLMTAARFNHTVTFLGNGRVLLAGGSGGSSTLRSAEVFDLGAGFSPNPARPTGIVSRKTHGTAGTFDVDLAHGGTECRSGGATGDYTIVLTFANALTSVGGASLTSGIGSMMSSTVDSTDTHRYIVNLTGIANAQTITVKLTSVSDNSGNASAALPVSMSVLTGDTSNDGAVNSADIGQTKSQSGALVTSSNFREDVTADGSVNSTDISSVKAGSGTGLP